VSPPPFVWRGERGHLISGPTPLPCPGRIRLGVYRARMPVDFFWNYCLPFAVLLAGRLILDAGAYWWESPSPGIRDGISRSGDNPLTGRPRLAPKLCTGRPRLAPKLCTYGVSALVIATRQITSQSLLRTCNADMKESCCAGTFGPVDISIGFAVSGASPSC
jgi:hypothetical protein